MLHEGSHLKDIKMKLEREDRGEAGMFKLQTRDKTFSFLPSSFSYCTLRDLQCYQAGFGSLFINMKNDTHSLQDAGLLLFLQN